MVTITFVCRFESDISNASHAIDRHHHVHCLHDVATFTETSHGLRRANGHGTAEDGGRRNGVRGTETAASVCRYGESDAVGDRNIPGVTHAMATWAIPGILAGH